MNDSASREGFFGGEQNFVDRLSDAAGIESVYGEPVTVGEKTVIPVARVVFGFGGGAGPSDDSTADEESEARHGSERWGGGGGVRASPVGVLEVTDRETRWVRFDDGRRNARWLVLGIAFGLLLGRRGKRHAMKRAMRTAERKQH